MPSTTGSEHSKVQGTGASQSFSFDEAFKAAMHDLQEKKPAPPGVADYMFQCRVVEIGARIGGIAGFRQMYVVVE
jgi:hypothetical protein